MLIVLAAGTWWLTRNVVVAITFSDFGDYEIFAELFDALHYGPSIKLWPLWCTFQPIWFNRVDDVAPVPEGWRRVARQRGAVLVENTRALARAFVPRRVRLGLPVAQQVAELGQQTDHSDTAWLSANVRPYERDNGPGSVRIAEYSPGGRYLLDATMERDGWIVISETAWKGWRAYVDGRRVEMQNANASFLAVHVPAGRHSVRVVYWPESFVTGRAISFATLLALIAFAVLRRVSSPA